MNFSFLKTYSSVLFLLSLFLAIIVTAFFVIRPLQAIILGQARSIQEFRAKEENQEKQVKRLPDLKKQYLLIEERSSALDILRNEDQIVSLIQTLEGVANETNVTLTITSKDNGTIIDAKKIATKKTKTVTKNSNEGDETSENSTNQIKSLLASLPFDQYLRLSVKVVGAYNDIVSFLHKIETLPVGLDVVGMDIKHTEQEKNNKNVQINRSPFLSSVSIGTNTDGLSSPEDAVIKDDMLDATFDIVVYINK